MATWSSETMLEDSTIVVVVSAEPISLHEDILKGQSDAAKESDICAERLEDFDKLYLLM